MISGDLNSTFSGPEICPNPADVVFVIDSSGSIEPHNFELVKRFVSSIVEELDVERQRIQVGAITFSTDVRLHFHLNAFASRLQSKVKLKFK